MGTYRAIALALNEGMALLPAKMTKPEALIQLVATGIQESGLEDRRQKFNGPAVSLLQFERIGIQDVLERSTSRKYALEVLQFAGIAADVESIWRAFQKKENDPAAFAFGRLNYWNSKIQLPIVGDIESAWKFYKGVWRPGKPHLSRWPESYWRAHGAIVG